MTRRRGATTALALLAGWGLGSLLLGSTLPGPVAVAERLPAVVSGVDAPGEGALVHLGVSLGRVLVATAVGLALAVPLGVLMGVDDRVEAAVSVWLPLWMTVPTLVVVLVAMVLFRFSDLSVVAAVVVAGTPYATALVWEGARNVDRSLVEMAAAFGADRRAVLREVYLPAVAPSVLGSARYLLSMVWKVVVLAETFGMNRGMGALFRFWFSQGDLTALLASLSLFVVVMVGLQAGVGRLEQRLFAWRA